MRTTARAVVRAAPVTAGYVGGVALVAGVMEVIGTDRAERVLRSASTNLGRLRSSPGVVLPASAFLLEHRDQVLLLPVLALSMGALERWRGGLTAAATFAAGHVGATLVVAGGLAVGVDRGWVDPSTSEVVDVGISYGAWTIAGAVAPHIDPRWRPVYVAGSTATLLSGLVARRSFTDVGHLLAWGIGLGIGELLVRLPATALSGPLAPPATPAPAR